MKQIRDNPHPGAIGQLDTLLAYGAKHGREVQRIAVDLRPFIIDDLGLVGPR